MLKNYQIRESARKRLKGNWGTGALITLATLGMAFGIMFLLAATFGGESLLESSFSDNPAYFLADVAVGVLIFIPLRVGTSWAFLRLVRYRKIEVGNVFRVFSSSYSKVTLTGFLEFIYIFSWTLLLIIPGIYKAFAYSLTPFILKDNPNLTANQAITKSRRMMDGNKGKLFVLSLTYIGWLLLSIVTLGIGLLWFIPYVKTSMAIFYEEIKKQEEPRSKPRPRSNPRPISQPNAESIIPLSAAPVIENAYNPNEMPGYAQANDEGVLPQGAIDEGVLSQGASDEGVLPQGANDEGVLPQGASDKINSSTVEQTNINQSNIQ